MKITIRHYNETANNVIKKLTNHKQTLLQKLVFSTTAYVVEDMLFECGKLDMVYMNEKDFIPLTAKACAELVELLLKSNNWLVASWTMDIAEFCTELCRELFSEKDYL